MGWLLLLQKWTLEIQFYTLETNGLRCFTLRREAENLMMSHITRVDVQKKRREFATQIERELGDYFPKTLYKITYYASCQESSHLIISVEL